MSEHPGTTIKRLMLAEGISQKAMAERLDISQAYLCDLLKGRRGISVHIARKLSKHAGMTPHFWMYQQVDYDLSIHDKDKKP